MGPEEANKIIAEFMGEGKFLGKDSPTCGYDVYWSGKASQSLDALVPVWEKLDLSFQIDNYTCFDDHRAWQVIFTGLGYKESCAMCGTVESRNILEEHRDLKKAAAIATAKAIQELK